MYQIYLISNSINGKYYIGKTCQKLQKRWTNHLSEANRGIVDTHFYRAIRKYGKDSFILSVITTCDTEEEANNLEKLWILSLNSHDPNTGYNSTLGGDGCKPTPETLEKLREVGRRHTHHTEEDKIKIGNAARGRKASPETIAKMKANYERRKDSLVQSARAANLGAKRSEESCQRMREGQLRYRASLVVADNRITNG